MVIGDVVVSSVMLVGSDGGVAMMVHADDADDVFAGVFAVVMVTKMMMVTVTTQSTMVMHAGDADDVFVGAFAVVTVTEMMMVAVRTQAMVAAIKLFAGQWCLKKCIVLRQVSPAR